MVDQRYDKSSQGSYDSSLGAVSLRSPNYHAAAPTRKSQLTTGVIVDIAIAGIMIVLIGFIGIALLALWIWALVDVIRMGDQIPYRTGNQLVWILVVALTQVIGAILYLAIGRPDAAQRHRR